MSLRTDPVYSNPGFYVAETFRKGKQVVKAAQPILVVLASVALVVGYVWLTEKYLRGRYSKSVNLLISIGFWCMLAVFWYLVHVLTVPWR